jgi:DNA-binding transcriptional MocR family regulator
VAALHEHLPAWEFAVPRGGGTLWIRLDTGSAVTLAEAAACHGVRLAPGPWFGLEGTLEGYLRLPYTQPPQVLREAVTRIADARHRGRVGSVPLPDSLSPMV